MKKGILMVSSALVIALITSCASIVSRSSYPISINSRPTEATISVTNSKGTEVYKGSTPATINLKSGGGFFKKAR
jgi:hypothetical protein